MLMKYFQDTVYSKMKTKVKYVCLILILIGIINYFGLVLHIFEKDFYTDFEYPLNEDIVPYMEQLRNNDKPSKPPINWYNFSFIKTSEEKCKDLKSIRLVILVKSALVNVERRIAIRKSFGFERRFSDVTVRTVFLLGVHESKDDQNKLQTAIDNEYSKYKDIIQIDFIDSYFNNTIKTMMGFHWVMKYCPQSKFYLFTDDDMYVSVKNVLRFVRNPSHYPEYVEESLAAIRKISRQKRQLEKLQNYSISSLREKNETDFSAPYLLYDNNSNNNNHNRSKRYVQMTNYDLPDDVILYTGFVFKSSPHRHRSSKWFVSLEEYPWHMWPPYVSAGAYIISKEALVTMFYASFYTAHFRFDDIYLGILAKKSGIIPFHCQEFYFYKKDYNRYNYRYVVASHGYDDSSELLKVWSEQKSAGNA